MLYNKIKNKKKVKVMVKNLYGVDCFIFDSKYKAEEFESYIKGKKFNNEQLAEIQDGVNQNLKVNYADPDLSVEKMEILKNALINNIKVNVGDLNFPIKDWHKIEIQKGFNQHINLIPYISKGLDRQSVQVVMFALVKNLKEIDNYLYSDFDSNQLYEIYDGLSEKIDVSIYAKKDYSSSQMYFIKVGLKEGINVEPYLNPKFTYQEMFQIYLGIVNNVDYSIYAKPEYNYQQMEKIRLGLENNLNVNYYCSSDLNYNKMKIIKDYLLKNKKPSKCFIFFIKKAPFL